VTSNIKSSTLGLDAILTMSWKVPLSDLRYGIEEEEAVRQVLRSGWLTMGSVTAEFEARFKTLTGARHALAVTNATVALHLACQALGIGPGDEVILPALTFVATANAVLYCGAEVVFAEVNGPDDLNLSPEDVESRITSRTKAIVAVHYGGYPAAMGELSEIAERHGLGLIEDAAHAPGAYLKGRHLGTYGDAGCFSFFSNKNLATGEGGMLVTNRDDLAEKARLLRSHGMTTVTWDRHQGHAYTYDVVQLGYNYRIDEMRSALGLAQLKKLPDFNRRRAEITYHYWRSLSETSLQLPFCSKYMVLPEKIDQQNDSEPAFHLFPILLPPGCIRTDFMEHMRRTGIQTSIHYPLIHLFSYYRQRYAGVSLPLSEELASRQVTLPLYPSMKDEQIELVIQAVIDYV
jgi:dTDP-4-amino-4,6-dideoxygalactose transaminase